MSEITSGLHRGIFHQGKLRVNRYNPYEAYVGSESIGDEIIIYGRENLNRAFDEDEEEEDVHLVPTSADDAPRNTNLVEGSVGDPYDTPSRPSGRVVGIIKRNWHS
ncbi:Rrp44-like cold shock domain [Dillenia turbinata]|uniref:Rrp44-like cold shock domain n=1 Tax=Dillenia turbinata TaxID=194707 RepID=A0AAN8Z7R8_9MAGN